MKRKAPTKWTTESFSKRIREISPTITVVGEYINMNTSIDCCCDVCGCAWSPSAQNLIRGTGCPDCARVAQSERMKNRDVKKTTWAQESFTKRVQEIDSSIEVIGDYVNVASTILCRCKKCNSEWAPTANNLLGGKSHCPYCSKEKAKSLTRMTHNEFVNRIAEINESIEIIGQYTNTKSRIKCRCKECGNVWSPTADSLLSGRKCKKCSYIENGPKLMKSQQEFLKELEEVNSSIEVIGNYIGIYEKVKCKCKICNYEWDAVPHYLLTGRGCPECSHSSTSFVEKAIYNAFKKALDGKCEVISRDKKAIGKELDVFIPQMRIAIEPGSWRYHYDKKTADNKKRELCIKNGITLLFVFYDYDGPVIHDSNTICFSESLSYKYDRDLLQQLIAELFNRCGIEMHFSDRDWSEIHNDAYMQSRRTTTQSFIERLKGVNPNIEVLGEYYSSRSKIDCKCKICGNKWEVTPNDLMQGRSCPYCATKRISSLRRYSQEEFIEKLKIVNPSIQVLGEYTDSKTKIKCKCIECGNEWDVVPSSLLKGSGCPECAIERGRSKRFYSHHEYVEKLAIANPEIEVLSEYKGSKSRIKCRCKICNTIWEPRADSLIKTKATGCPACRKRCNK